MSYVIRDPLGPALSTYAYNKRFKNRILKYWPTKWVNGVKVFDKLYIYIKGRGVLQDENRLKIYKLLGMKVSDLEAQDYKGLDATYLEVPEIDRVYDMTNQEIMGYLADMSPRIYPENKNLFSSDPETGVEVNLNPDPYQNNPRYRNVIDDSIIRDPETGDLPSNILPEPQWDKDGWITDFVVYEPGKLIDQYYKDVVTDEEIINAVKRIDPKYVSINGVEHSSPIFFAALKDTAGVLYEKKYEIVQKRLVDKQTTTVRIGNRRYSEQTTSSKYLHNAIVRVKYRRINSPDAVEVEGLINAIKADLEALNNPYTSSNMLNMVHEALLKRDNSSTQLKKMHVYVNGYEYNSINYAGYVRYDGMEALTGKQFGETFANAIEFGYKETPAEWWEKAISIVIDIIVVIVVIILAVIGQWWAIPLAFSIGSLTQAGLAAYWAGQGKYAAASYAGKHAQYLSVAAEVSGFIINPWLSIALKLFEMVAKELGVPDDIILAVKITGQIAAGMMEEDTFETEDVIEVLKNISPEQISNIVAETIDDIAELTVEEIGTAIVEMVDSMEISNLTNNFSVSDWISLLNKSFQFYTVYMNPPAKTDDLSQKIEAQNEELETLEGPELIATIERQFSDPYDNYIDGNARLHRVPQDMTHGLNAALMNKYYNSGY